MFTCEIIQEAPYPPPPPSYPQEWARSQPPQQFMYPPGARQPWPNGDQQAHGPFYPPGPPQDQWLNGPLAPQQMPNLHPGPLYPPNHFVMNHDQGNRQAPHPGASLDLSDIPIAEIYPPPVSFTPPQSHQHQHQTATDPFVWSSAEQQANQPLLASTSIGTDDDDEEEEMKNFMEAFAPSLNR